MLASRDERLHTNFRKLPAFYNTFFEQQAKATAGMMLTVLLFAHIKMCIDIHETEITGESICKAFCGCVCDVMPAAQRDHDLSTSYKLGNFCLSVCMNRFEVCAFNIASIGDVHVLQMLLELRSSIRSKFVEPFADSIGCLCGTDATPITCDAFVGGDTNNDDIGT